MGGWTRIWVVVTVVAAAIAGANYFSAMKAAESSAQDATDKALAAYDECRKELAGPRPTDSQLAEQAKGKGTDALIAQGLLSPTHQAGTAPNSATSAFDQYLGDICGYARRPRDQYAQQQSQRRDDALAKARSDALSEAASTLGWVSGMVGALFLATGWVRRGFRRKVQR